MRPWAQFVPPRNAGDRCLCLCTALCDSRIRVLLLTLIWKPGVVEMGPHVLEPLRKRGPIVDNVGWDCAWASMRGYVHWSLDWFEDALNILAQSGSYST